MSASPSTVWAATSAPCRSLAVPSGYAELLTWADSLGPVYAIGVEGTGSYGSGLAKLLRRHGRNVIEVSRPPRAAERPGNGKSDAIDAEHAALDASGHLADPNVAIDNSGPPLG